VKLDTVLPGNSAQYITMHYGRRDAPDFSDGKAVFASFGGVWHFSEALDADGEGAFADASPAMSAGMARVLPSDRRGFIGPGAAFRGVHNVVAPVSGPAQRPARALTVSAWTYAQGTGRLGGEFLSMGDNYGLRVLAKGAPHFFVFTDTSVHDPAWNEDNPFNIVEAGAEDIRADWRLVTGRYDGATLKVYIDGVERASVACAKDIQYPFRQEFWIGQHANGNNPAYAFTGSLDEVRMSPLARSPAWIRLSYLNQKAGSLLIEFR
jgi:biopolymer transport protein ExbB